MFSLLRMWTDQLGKYKVLLCFMGFLFGFCCCKFCASQPLQLHILNLCWNNVFICHVFYLTGTLHGLGAILNYSNGKPKQETFFCNCGSYFMLVCGAWILFENHLLGSRICRTGVQTIFPWSKFFVQCECNMRNEFACCQHTGNSYVDDMMLICVGVCALHNEEQSMHVLLPNSRWILLSSHLGYFLQVQLCHAAHIWNIYMVENWCQVWNQQYA